MKQFLGLAVVLVVFGCHSGSIQGHFIANKLDTIPKAIYKIRAANGVILGPYADTVVNQIISKLVLKDTANNSGAHWQNDTTSYGRITDDTLRDSNRKPLYDSLKHVRWHTGYYPVLKGTLVPYPY